MSALKSVLLADRGVLRISGGDAVPFLQGLITNDMAQLETNDAIHAGLLSPQGKILFDFFVVRNGNEFLLETAREQTSALVQRLSMYKLRADVTIEDVSPDFTVAAVWGAQTSLPSEADAIHFTDPRLGEMGLRLLVTLASDWLPGELDAKPASHDDYDALRIALGVPEGGKDFAFGDTFAHEALFDQLAGVSFTKGCFVGQEIVSRMQHRSTARRRVVPLIGAAPLPPSGTEVRAGSSLIGTLGTVSANQALAKLRLDRAQDALNAGTPLTAGDIDVTIKLPSWATFSMAPSNADEPSGEAGK